MATVGEVYSSRASIHTLGSSSVRVVLSVTFIPDFAMLCGLMILD